MYVLISPLPGLQFYIIELKGKLNYSLAVPKKPTKHFDLSDSDFDPSDVRSTSKDKDVIDGIHVSAVGLQLILVQNNGYLTFRFEGSNGSTTQREFLHMQDTSKAVASMITQTGIATLVMKNKPKSGNWLIPTTLEAEIRALHATITSVTYQNQEGRSWTVNPAVPKELHPDVQHEATQQTNIPQSPPTALRSSKRQKRAPVEEEEPLDDTEVLPRYLFFKGVTYQDEVKRRGRTYGEVRLDRLTGEFGFWKDNGTLLTNDIPTSRSNSVMFDMAAAQTCGLSVLQDGVVAFTSCHRSYDQPTGSDEESVARKVPIDRFLGALRDRFIQAQKDENQDQNVLQVQKVDDE